MKYFIVGKKYRIHDRIVTCREFDGSYMWCDSVEYHGKGEGVVCVADMDDLNKWRIIEEYNIKRKGEK